jgi:hypothetical protein
VALYSSSILVIGMFLRAKCPGKLGPHDDDVAVVRCPAGLLNVAQPGGYPSLAGGVAWRLHPR